MGEQTDRPGLLVPHVGGHRYGWTHYGVTIPNLPEPHRYFSIMVIAGLPGGAGFDNDEAVVFVHGTPSQWRRRHERPLSQLSGA